MSKFLPILERVGFERVGQFGQHLKRTAVVLAIRDEEIDECQTLDELRALLGLKCWRACRNLESQMTELLKGDVENEDPNWRDAVAAFSRK